MMMDQTDKEHEEYEETCSTNEVGVPERAVCSLCLLYTSDAADE